MAHYHPVAGKAITLTRIQKILVMIYELNPIIYQAKSPNGER